MATKSYSKHKEYKEFKSSGNVAPYTDEQFDMLKSELIPKSKLASSLDHNGGHREYHYEYKEEKHPSGKYDRKDMRTVERQRDPLSKFGSLERNGGRREYHYQSNEDYQPPRKYDTRYAVEEFTVPPKSTPKSNEHSSYFYEREERELPVLNTSSAARTYNYETSNSSTPGYSKVRSSTVKKDLSQNVEELDSLLDDLQKDQDRQLYKSGYTSDTAESTSFDYRKGTPAKAPSSGYSTLKKEERVESSSWGGSPPPTVTRAAEIRQQLYREEKTESRVVPSQISPAIAQPVPAPVCNNCHHSTLNTLNTVSNTGTLTRSGTPGMNKVTTTVKTYTYEVPAGTEPGSVPLPAVADFEHTYRSADQRTTSTTNQLVPPSPSLGCQHCAHCNSRITTTHVTSNTIAPPAPTWSAHHQVITSDDRTNERIVYPKPVIETKLVPGEPYPNGHAPYGPTNYKFSETTYSAHNTTERYPPAPLPAAAPFPRASTPAPGDQQPPKRLDDLMADFPDARFPTQPDGVTHRKIQVTHESSTQASKPTPPVGSSRNVAGPAVYYPPGHTPFEKKETAGYQSAAMQSGGAHASGRGMYEYESGSKSKQKHSEKKTAVPICLPLCCAMPCVIM